MCSSDLANKGLGMELFLRDASFHGVMLDSLHDAHPATRTALGRLLQEGLDSGLVHPLPARVFNWNQVEPAFRYMGTGKHIGKVLVQIRDQGLPPPTILARPRIYFSPTSSYIVIGGLGGLGLEFVDWMVNRGARKLLIASRSGLKTAHQRTYIRVWAERHGANVQVLTADVSTQEGARSLLASAESLGPLDGVFNLAGMLELGLMADQTEESFASADRKSVV